MTHGDEKLQILTHPFCCEWLQPEGWKALFSPRISDGRLHLPTNNNSPQVVKNQQYFRERPFLRHLRQHGNADDGAGVPASPAKTA